MTRDELDDVYATLCDRLTGAGTANTEIVLARLTMLLIQNMNDAPLVVSLINEAVDGYADQANSAHEGTAS